jgi:PAS domain-containing protein
MSAASQTNTISNPLSTFEFTKRKRWADILVTGLTDVIIFVLSPEGKVLYCGTAVNELLGWNETDILDLRLDDFIIGALTSSVPTLTCLTRQRARTNSV